MNPVPDNGSEQFGPYDVYERLGMGGMAQVHRAKKRGPQGYEQNVALKRMLAHLAEDQSFVESFVREAKVASLLVHPNIAQIYDFGRIRGVYYIAMELVGGFDVRKLLRYANRSNEAIPLGVVLSILGELCDALDHAHNFVDETGTRLDIVHRDVSPSNLVVAHTGHLKVIDFGIAKASTRQLHTESGKVKGKLGYMSPEAALGMSSGPISDLFSAGVVAWELVTASPLFTTRTDMETMQRIREGVIKPPSHHNPACPPELDQLILAALEREPERRLSSAAAFRAGLDDLASRNGIHVSARSVVEWMTRFAQPEDGWARVSARDKPPTGRNSPVGNEVATSVQRGSVRPQRPSEGQRPRTPSRPPVLRRSAEHIALATEIWGEDQQTVAPEPGPDFSIANLRDPAAAQLLPASSPVTRVLGPSHPPMQMPGLRMHEAAPSPARASAATGPPPMRGTNPPIHTQIPALPLGLDAREGEVVPDRGGVPLAGSSARMSGLPLRGRPSTPPAPAPILAPSAPLVPMRAPIPEPAPRRSKWPILLLALLAVVAGVLIAVLASRGDSKAEQVALAPADASTTSTAIESDAPDRDHAVLADAAAAEPSADAGEITMPRTRKPPAVKPPKTDKPPRTDKPPTVTKPPVTKPPVTKPDPPPEKPDPAPVVVTPPVKPVEPPPTQPTKPARTPVVGVTAVTKLSGEIPTLRGDTTADSVTVKMCIDEFGHVTSVTGKIAADVLGELQRGLAGWRYKPFEREGKPAAVCFPLSIRLVKRG